MNLNFPALEEALGEIEFIERSQCAPPHPRAVAGSRRGFEVAVHTATKHLLANLSCPLTPGGP